MNLSALTNTELEAIADALEAIHRAYDSLEAAGALTDTDDLSTDDLLDAVVEELTERAYIDAGFKVNQMVARGELDRYMRPDGQVGYAPPGMFGGRGA